MHVLANKSLPNLGRCNLAPWRGLDFGLLSKGLFVHLAVLRPLGLVPRSDLRPLERPGSSHTRPDL
jgi:hypothetical protein